VVRVEIPIFAEPKYPGTTDINPIKHATDKTQQKRSVYSMLLSFVGRSLGRECGANVPWYTPPPLSRSSHTAKRV
jgi:hypothetical protein